jgi:6-pyruvoyltetrahydropterin/6-carboxytetrahydropterin synthase
MIITREFVFDSAHRLEWEPGKCKQLHGHTYRLQVSVEGKLNENGIIINFTELKDIVKKKILDELDHKYLNELISNPTAENIVLWIWDKLKSDFNLYEVKLWETPTCFVLYRGDEK